MPKNNPQKHFLDSSIIRQLFCGTRASREYYDQQFKGNNLYTSTYVQMEVRRSFLLSLIAFYFVLDLDEIKTIDDGVSFWSNRFSKAELKAVLQIICKVFSTHNFDFFDERDKPKALSELAAVIKRYEITLTQNYRNTGINSMRCARGDLKIKVELRAAREGLKKFADKFNDKAKCRTQCRIDSFLLTRHLSEIKAYSNSKSNLKVNRKTKGFLMICESLEKVLSNGGSVCSCDHCATIGDAVIALDTPRNMRIETIDNSFDFLCPPLNQPHFLHPSETAIVKGNKTS